MPNYAHPERLASTQWVAGHLDDPTVRVVEVVWGASASWGRPDWSLRADRDYVLQTLGRSTHRLVDARSAEMYAGADQAGAPRGGHIPGAINLVARRETGPDGSVKGWRVPTVQGDGAFRPAEELQELFDGLGIVRGKPIITYCVRGGLSTHAWFVLTQRLGYDGVREYDRSWAEWGSVEGLPIEP
jgi:thiosulfate/3-mercaptopyruvate sulfurtransferase